MSADITILGIRDHTSDAVRAEFDVQLGGVLIRDVRLVDGRNGTFLGMPSRKNRETDQFYDVVELSAALKSRVRQAAEAALAPPPSDASSTEAAEEAFPRSDGPRPRMSAASARPSASPSAST